MRAADLRGSRRPVLPHRRYADPLASERTVQPHLLRRDGAHQLDFLDAELVDGSLAALDAVGIPENEPFFASPAHGFGDVAEQIHRELVAILEHRCRKVLPGYKVFMIAATVKGAANGRQIKFHHDWTYTDERIARAVFIWVPFVDCDRSTGSLGIVPGSHRWSTGIRPSRTIEVTEAFQPECERLAHYPPYRAGQGMVFDPATLHGSPPNPTAYPRPAITVALAPVGAELLHFHLDDSGDLAGYRVDSEFFVRNPYGSRPIGREPFRPWTHAVSPGELARGSERALSRATPGPIRRLLKGQS